MTPREIVAMDTPLPDRIRLLFAKASAETRATWARWCALQVAHLLPPETDPVVRQWLETGDLRKRNRARKAALAAMKPTNDVSQQCAARAAAAAASTISYAYDTARDAVWANDGCDTWESTRAAQLAELLRLIEAEDDEGGTR